MRHLRVAMLIVALLSTMGAEPAGAVTPGKAIRDCAGCPEMRVVPAGSFDMGAVGGDTEAKDDERPRHRVTIAKAFAVGIYEVTRAQFAKFIESTGHDAGNSCHGYEDGKWQGKWENKEGWSWRQPGYAQEADHPVVCIDWHDAQRYVAWLSTRTGKHYRLLTEAEWEYIAQTGKVSVSHDTANYGAEAHCCTSLAAGNDRWLTTAPVGSFSPDALGLYDVRGNVWEWLEDCYNDNYNGASSDGSARTSDCSLADRRAVRGGGWGDPSRLLRVTYRLRSPVGGRYFGLGFRVARDLE